MNFLQCSTSTYFTFLLVWFVQSYMNSLVGTVTLQQVSYIHGSLPLHVPFLFSIFLTTIKIKLIYPLKKKLNYKQGFWVYCSFCTRSFLLVQQKSGDSSCSPLA